MMSIPSMSFLSDEFVIWGRDNTRTRLMKNNMWSMGGRYMSLVRQLFGTPRYFDTLGISRLGKLRRYFVIFHNIYGIKSNNRKRQYGYLNSIRMLIV